jgi:hypothetical protein
MWLIIVFLVTIIQFTYAENIKKFEFSMIRINEIRSTGLYDYIEIYNNSPYIIRFPKGWFILNHEIDYNNAIMLPENTLLEPGKFLLILPNVFSVPDEISKNIPVITADNNSGFDLVDNGEVRLIYWSNNQETLVDIFGWGGASDSWGYYPDGSTNLFSSLVNTPGEPNVVRNNYSNPPTLIISEVQTKGSPDFPYDYVEIYNFGSLPVLCNGISITNNVGSPVISLPENIVIEPGGFALIVPNEFDLDLFSEFEIDNIILAESNRTTFGLKKNDEVRLLFFGSVLDCRSWGDYHLLSGGIVMSPPYIWSNDLIPTPGYANIIR